MYLHEKKGFCDTFFTGPFGRDISCPQEECGGFMPVFGRAVDCSKFVNCACRTFYPGSLGISHCNNFFARSFSAKRSVLCPYARRFFDENRTAQYCASFAVGGICFG